MSEKKEVGLEVHIDYFYTFPLIFCIAGKFSHTLLIFLNLSFATILYMSSAHVFSIIYALTPNPLFSLYAKFSPLQISDYFGVKHFHVDSTYFWKLSLVIFDFRAEVKNIWLIFLPINC